MYKPHTIEQYKIQRFLDDTFAMEHFLVSPLSRTSLLLEDETGEQLAFGFLDDEVREIPLPPPADLEKSKISSGASGPSIPNRVCVLLKILPAGGWTTPIP